MIPGFGDFHFLRPVWLLLALAAPVLFSWLKGMASRVSAWDRIAQPQLLSYLKTGEDGAERPGWRWLVVAAWLIAALAAAGPTFQKQTESLYRSEAALVIAMDLSRSMLATDLTPDRISLARFKLKDILARKEEGQTGLVAYAGEAFVVSPLTDDANTITAMVDPLHPDIMPAPGSEADEALELAAELIERVEVTGEILLMTDSVSDAAIETARTLAGRGIRTSVLGIGTTQGAPIPLGDQGVLKGPTGDIVIAQLDVERLQRLADAGHGQFVRITGDDRDIAQLLGSGPDSDAGIADTDREGERWRDDGPWLVLFLLPLALLAFRRGLILSLMAVSLMPMDSAHALGLDQLWRNQEQRAEAAIEAGDFERASKLAEDPIRRGNAYYRAGDFNAAAQAYAQADTPDGYYNRGNALARSQRYEEAIAAYDEALRRSPGMEDAEHNKKLIEDLLNQQQQQQEQSSDNQQDGEPTEAQESEGDQSEQQQDGEQQEQQQQQQQTAQEGQQPEAAEEDSLNEEERQALEQWLRRIPDDPGGLLRRKFLLEYRRRGEPPPESDEDW